MEKNQKKQVPDLKLDEQQRIVDQTRDIPLKINGKEAIVKIRKLKTGVRNKIKSECTKTKFIGGQPSITVNDTEIQEKILSECIVSAPFDSSVSGIKLLPAEISDYLFDEYTEFAEPTEQKKD